MATELAKLFARKAEIESRLEGFEIWLLVFGVLVVVGVAGESIFGIRAWWNNRKLHEVQQEIDSERQSETIRLDTRVAEAEARAAEANLELFKLKTPRTLDATQEARIAAKLKMFHGISFRISQYQDPEALAFADEIEKTLHSIGWTGPVGLPPEMNLRRAVVGSGILVEVDPNRATELTPAATALVSALQAEHIDATLISADLSTDMNDIHIRVGKKP